MKPGNIASSDELLSLAHSLEQAHARRCADLGMRLRALGFAAGAAAFAQAAVQAEAARASASVGGPSGASERGEITPQKRAAVLAEAGWREAEDPAPLTPYRALAWSVEQAERRFRLYGALAAVAKETEVCRLAEDLAQAELTSAARLRVLRRQAYRAERAAGRRDLVALARLVRSPEDLRRAALEIETEVLAQLAAVARPLPAERALALTREVLKALGGSCSDVPKAGAAKAATIAAALDEAFHFYDLVQSRAVTEAVMERAQWLAQRTLDRMRVLGAED